MLAGRALAALGVGAVLAFSTALVAGGLAGFALAPARAVFVTCAVVVGLGSGAIDAAINTYAAVHLPAAAHERASRLYGIGATLRPTVMTATLATAPFREGGRRSRRRLRTGRDPGRLDVLRRAPGGAVRTARTDRGGAAASSAPCVHLRRPAPTNE